MRASFAGHFGIFAGAIRSLMTAVAAMTAICLAVGPATAQGGFSVHAKTTPSDSEEAKPEAAPAKAVPSEATAPAGETAAAPAGGDAGEAAAGTPDGAASGTEQAAAPSSPVGAGWETDTRPQLPAETAELTDEEALRLVQKVNDYFNNLDVLQAQFVQTDADTSKKRGTFYFKQPGKARFDYAPPSKMKIISDGKYLAVENHDLRTADRYPLESTPFKLLLRQKVDLLKDSRILSIDKGEDIVIIALEDKTGESAGRIRLFFKTDPEFQLASWIVTDPQGLDTRIDLSNIQTDVELASDLFRFSDIGLPTFNR